MLTRPPGGLAGALGAIGISIGNACAVRSRVADLWVKEYVYTVNPGLNLLKPAVVS